MIRNVELIKELDPIAQEKKDKIYVLFKASWLWWLFCWKLLDWSYIDIKLEFIMDGYFQQA